jgi:NADH-quinone oxidoreductase subunit L
MPTAALLLIIATLLPAASFLLLAILGKRLGQPLAGWVATALLGGCLACSLGGMIAWFNNGELAGSTWGPGDQPIEISVKWLPIGGGVAQDHPGFLDAVIYVDSLTIILFNTTTLVALLVHFYCMGHLRGNENFSRFFAALGFLTFASLGLFISGSLIQIFVFWQLLSLGTFLLSGYWQANDRAIRAASIIYLVHVLCDVGFVFALGILVHKLGNTANSDLIRWLSPLGTGEATIIHLPGGQAIPVATQTLVGLGLLCAAVAKCAIFPLQDIGGNGTGGAAASAVMQTVGGAAAGIFLIARMLPILTPQTRLAICILGLAMMLGGALLSAVPDDLHEALGFNTVSQIGMIFLALGIGSWMGGLFLLVTHAFSKSLLFLSAGIVSRRTGGKTDLGSLGGMLRKTPFAAVAFAVGALAIVGTPFTSGFYSQDMVLNHLTAFSVAQSQMHHVVRQWAIFILPIAAVGMTAFAMMRCWMLIFWGRPRLAEYHGKVKESAIVWAPMAVLATFTIVGGSRLLEIKGLLAQAVSETENFCYVVHEPSSRPSASLLQAWPVDVDPQGSADSDDARNPQTPRGQEEVAKQWLHPVVPWVRVGGIGLAALLYLRGFAIAGLLLQVPPLRWIHGQLRGRYWRKKSSEKFVESRVMGLIGGAAAFDRRFVDGLSDFCARVFGGNSR